MFKLVLLTDDSISIKANSNVLGHLEFLTMLRVYLLKTAVLVKRSGMTSGRVAGGKEWSLYTCKNPKVNIAMT